MRTIAGAIGAVVLVAALSVGVYQGGWWLSEDGVNRRAEINNQSFARQSALQEEVIDKYRVLADIDVQISTATDSQAAPLKAQRKAVLDQLCLAWGQMTETATVPATAATYAERNCQ